ncbi:hypothetical protein L210DRAFT_3564897 [Boletus edulis BED1]|uniref:Uncharacterized protein n=1 Tax=Boletus edulis BED1 TaxID=1328754 RepID=A0AAD4BGT9_BOLED|nr:hypothetical protein L210DRAFT_3564897 [Boletus edulis BED1]
MSVTVFFGFCYDIHFVCNSGIVTISTICPDTFSAVTPLHFCPDVPTIGLFFDFHPLVYPFAVLSISGPLLFFNFCLVVLSIGDPLC